MTVELPNIHPADELGALREEIAQLGVRADQLRAQLLTEGASLRGESHLASDRCFVRIQPPHKRR